MTTVTTQFPAPTTPSQPVGPRPLLPAATRRYIYCVTEPDAPASLGPIGIGANAEVYAIADGTCAAIVSATSLDKLEISRGNTLAHQRVMEAVMQSGHTVLPVRFNTIAEDKGAVTADQRIIDRVLGERREEMRDLLLVMRPLVELGVKGLWKNMDEVFKGLVENDREIQFLRKKLLGPTPAGATRRGPGIMNARVKLGEMVKKALEVRKSGMETALHALVVSMAADTRKNKTFGDPMFANLALLVDKSRQEDVLAALSTFQTDQAGQVILRCVGPLPACNFLELVIRWDD